MVPKKCLICCGASFGKKNGTQDATSSPFPSAGNFNGQQAEGKNRDTELQILFLLRKLLEIPESTFCLLREHFGNASVWIECCDSCLDLVEECKGALEQAELFQKQYEELRANIKTTILKSQKTFISESKCEVIVRAHLITQEIDNFINTTETGADEEAFLDGNVKLYANNLTVPVLFEKINIVKSEEDDITISFNENDDMDCNLEPTDIENGMQSGYTSVCENEKEDNESNCQTIQSGIPIKSANDNLNQFGVTANQNKSPQENLSSINTKVEKKFRVSIRGVKNNAEKKYKCHTCLKLFKLPHQLRSHLCSHFSSDKKCVTKMKQNSKTHLIKGATEENHQCNICGKSFAGITSLKYHMAALHNGETPFVCVICGKGFSFPCYLKLHSKQHSGEKPFECDICGKAFISNSRLKDHQMTHSESKPFKCGTCDKSFKWKSNLTQHSKIHNEETSE